MKCLVQVAAISLVGIPVQEGVSGTNIVLDKDQHTHSLSVIVDFEDPNPALLQNAHATVASAVRFQSALPFTSQGTGKL